MDVKDCSGQSSRGQPHSQIWILIFVVFYSSTAIRFLTEAKAILSDLERDRAFDFWLGRLAGKFGADWLI